MPQPMPTTTDARTVSEVEVVQISDDGDESAPREEHPYVLEEDAVSEVAVHGDGNCMLYAVAGRVGANAGQRAAVVRGVKARIEEFAFTKWELPIPTEWCCGDAVGPAERLGSFMAQYAGFGSFEAYRAALWSGDFEGSVDELWMLALGSGCRFHVYRARGTHNPVYERYLVVGVRGPVMRRLLWREGRHSGGHHYDVLLLNEAPARIPAASSDADWMLHDTEIRRRLIYRGPWGRKVMA